MGDPEGGHGALPTAQFQDVRPQEERPSSSLLARAASFSERRKQRKTDAGASQPDERLGHLHARRFTTSEDGLSVTESPLARTAHAMSSAKLPPPPKIRRATLTQSDAKLYAMTQGLVPMMNTPNSTPTSALQSIGTVCWPFQKDTDLSLVVPPLPPGLLPDVKPQDFNLYKQRFASRLARFEAARNSQFVPRVDSEDFIPGQSQHIAGEGLVQAMRAVPLEFFAEDFSLQKAQTWQALCGTGEDTDRTEKMDLYANHLDTVETHLLQEIAARSSHFFEAAGTVADLRGTLTRTYQQVAGLREQVGNLKGDSAGAVATQQHLQRRRKNLTQVLDHVKVLEGITAAQEALDLLLPAGDFSGALDVLWDLKTAGTPAYVTGLHAFQMLPQQLAACEEKVNAMMAEEFLRVTQCTELDAAMDAALSSLQPPQRSASSGNLQTAPREPLIADPGRKLTDGSKLYSEEAVLQLLATGTSPDSTEQLKDSLTPLVAGLRKTGKLGVVLASFRDAVSQHTKALVREAVERAVPVVLSADKRSSLVSLQDRLQALSAADFLKILEAILIVSAPCLGHAASIKDAVSDILAAARAPTALLAEAAQGCTEAITAASEAAHACWVRLLNARPAVPSRLQLAELEQLIAASDALSFMAESAGARPVHTLRNAIQLQCKTFLEDMHTHSLTQLTGLLEQEQWTAALVARDFQRSVDGMERKAQAFLHTNGNGDSAHLSHVLPASDNGQVAKQLQNGGTSAHDKGHMGDGEAKAQAHLRVGGKDYHVVAAVLMMLGLIESYLHYQEVVPVFTGEVAHRIVELLKVFNSRTCQLVLGAGALAAAGLRSITAKHLAMAAQCVGSIMGLHPSLTAILTGPLPHTRRAILLPDFERLLQDLKIHRNEIHSKLVAIMRERLAVNLKQLPSIAASWGNGAPGLKQPSAFAQTNAKQLRILCQVLSPLLLEEELHIIFGRVSNLFSKSLADAYARLEPLGPAWEAQCHADTHLMLSTLRALPLDPQTGSSTMDHLTQLCTLRFADPSPSGYTIPGQLPSPVSYSSASLGSTPGTASSLAAAPGLPSPSAGRQLEQVWQSQPGAYSSGLESSPARQQLPSLHALQGRESADGQEMQMEPISDSEPHAVAAAHALVPSSAVIKDDAQQHASSASLGMPGNAFRQSQAEQPQGSSGHITPGTGEASMPAQLSLPSEDVLNSEGLTSASLDDEGAVEQRPGPTLPVRKLPSFALPDRQPSSTQDHSREADAGSGIAQQWSSAALDDQADPLGATGRVGRRSTDASPRKPAVQIPADTEDVSHRMPGWSPSRSSAGSSPSHYLTAPNESAVPSMSLHAASAAPAALQPLRDASFESQWAASSSHPIGVPDRGLSLSRAPEAPLSPDNSASAGIRALTREISELAYVDRDPSGSPMRRYRPTEDAEEHHASAAAEDRSDASVLDGPQQSNNEIPRPEQDAGREAEHLAAAGSLGQDAVAGQSRQEMLRPLPDQVGD